MLAGSAVAGAVQEKRPWGGPAVQVVPSRLFVFVLRSAGYVDKLEYGEDN